MSFISNKSQKTPHSVIREMFALQTGLDNVISFALGEPDFTAPQHVIDATVASLQRGETHYTPNAGIPALRQAVSDLYKRRGLDYKPSEVLIGAGAISMLNLACTAMLDIGDEVLVPDPGWANYVGLMMHSVTTIINAITYVLIAFVAVSLVVSSIMIGVITLISVQERTKEIGILRAIGASKANVSSMFNAETVIIGFTSGLLGVGVTWGLCIPINAILRHFTGIESLRAYLPWQAALVLVAISVLLTLIAGIIPSRSAAKKDPVVALRSE